jgi:hypothetical protein
MKTSQSTFVLLVGLALSGCATSSSAPARHYVLGENASLCFEDDARLAQVLFARQNIYNVTPLYATFSSHGSMTSRVTGAQIEMRGVPVGPERLENVVECHRQALARGSVAQPSSDPYALSDEQMKVAVGRGERGELVIKLSCPAIEDAREVLSRAYGLIGRASPIAAR